MGVWQELFCNSGFYWKWTGEWSQLESQPSPVQVSLPAAPPI
jgi:hypothetical protein